MVAAALVVLLIAWLFVVAALVQLAGEAIGKKGHEAGYLTKKGRTRGMVLAAFGLVLAGPMLRVPYLGCLGLPLGLLAALAVSLTVVFMGWLEVPWWRQLAGVALAFLGLYLFFVAYLEGLGTIAEHFLDRRSAPPLSDLWLSARWLALAAGTLGGSVVLRRNRGIRYGVGVGVVASLTAGLGWVLLVLLGILGFPFGA